MAQGQFSHRKGGSALEKVSAGLGFIVTAAMVGFLGWKAVTMGAGTPPDVQISADRLSQSGKFYIVEFVAHNRSPSTAANLQVEGVLKRGDSEVERSQATLDYVPGDSDQHGGLVFTQNPAAYDLHIRSTGYQAP